MRALLVLFAAVFVLAQASARDDGRYAGSPLKEWFEQLESRNGKCCSFADGKSIEDIDWESKDGHYRVRLNRQWIDVPDEAVIKEPNRLGPAVVWPYSYNDDDGKPLIRCFMPGALS